MPTFSRRTSATFSAVSTAGFLFTTALLGAPPAAPPPAAETKAEAAATKKDESIQPAPPRRADEGQGPFDRLVLRGATLIDGTGAPPVGPVDLVIEKNRIADVVIVGSPGAPIDPENRPKAKAGDQEMDLSGMYVLPGFVDMHGHIGGVEQGTPAEYVYKLWMGHGITTIRDPGSGNGLDWVLSEKNRSAWNEIVAPRIHPYVTFGQGRDEPFTTADEARAWVRSVAKKGAEGLKFFGARPDLMRAALDEAKKLGLRSACHHAQVYVSRVNVLDSARWGLTSMEHWYGLPEALFVDRTIQDYPVDYNYANEADRFGEAGRLWKQAAPRGSERWNQVIDDLVKLDFTIDPTLTIYEANRDVMRARRAEWHEEYTLPSLWDFYSPSRTSHGSYWFAWGTEQEVAWKENYRIWMSFLLDYKNAGGRVTTGSDSGYIYKLYGFDYIRELELLREAGFHPLEVIRSATLWGAQALGVADQVGSVEPGKLADLVVVGANPIENLGVLYGTGAIHLTEDNKVERIGGVRYTIKDGIVYDAKQLLADVRSMVRKAKDEAKREIVQPGMAK